MEDTTEWMKRQFGRIPLLTSTQEIECGRIIQEWQTQERKLACNLNQDDDLTDEEKKLLNKQRQKIRRMGIKARDKMVSANARLAFSYVYNKFAHVRNNEDLQDMFQEAIIGLTRAAEKFDPEKGYKFSTYSYWWIKHYIQRWLDTQSRLIRLPVNNYLTAKKIEQIHSELGPNASTEEVANKAGITTKKAKLIKAAPIVSASLDQPLNEDGLTFSDTLYYDSPPSWIEELSDAAAEAAGSIDKILDQMLPEHCELLARNYGLSFNEPQSYVAIAQEKKTSPQKIRADALKAQRSFRFIARRITMPPIHTEPFDTNGASQTCLF